MPGLSKKAIKQMRANRDRALRRRWDNLTLDVAESIWVNRQLESTKARVYERKFPNLLARTLVPIDNSMGEHDNVLTVKTYNQVGAAKLIASYADDLPRADVLAQEAQVKVVPAGNSYGWDIFEMRKAKANGEQLDQRKANAARRAYEILVDRIMAVGDVAAGLYGLLTQPNANVYTPATGEAGSTEWENKTGEEMLNDLIGLIETVPANTNDIEQVNRVVMPRTEYRLANTTRVHEDERETVLDTIKAMYPSVTFLRWSKCEGAGTAGVNRIVAYDANPDALIGIIPKEWEQLPAQERGLEVYVPCVGRIGGVQALLPLSMAYMDGSGNVA